MAIVKMNKISLIGLESDKDCIIESLMGMGVVEIKGMEHKISEQEWLEIVERDGDEAQVTELESDIGLVKSAIEHLSKVAPTKKGLFEPKRNLSRNQYDNIIQNKQEVWDTVKQINGYTERLSSLRSEENRLLNLIGSLEPWKDLSIPVEISSTKNTVVSLGVVPSLVDTDELSRELYKQVPESYIEIVNKDQDQSYLSVICFNAYEEETMSVLKQYGFVKVAFKEIEGTISENIVKANNEIQQIGKDREIIEKDIAALANKKQDIEVLHDYLLIEKDRKKVLNKLVKTEKVFMLDGWLPEELGDKVKSQIEEKWDCIIEIQKPEKEEEFPILLNNSSFVQPFEMITELYSLPSSKGIDPNLFMAPFYFVFFGLMVSDAGYGLSMAIITGIFLMKYKLEGMAHKLIKLLFFGGISTFFWGVLFGGWFGNIFQILTNQPDLNLAVWFDPLKDPMRLLTWAFIFGGIHLYVGMGLQAYKLIKEGQYLDAFFDIGSWYILLTGLAFLILGGQISVIGQYMAIAGAVLLVLTQGRAEKGIIKKFLMGLLSLYNVTGYLSDVLSYSRLLALGLATGVIATVINTMGSLFGFNIIGIIILIIVFIGGHAFNILINALGAYVHASRLQYVEFFGKFYEGGGKAFEPFKIKTKYIQVDNKEAN